MVNSNKNYKFDQGVEGLTVLWTAFCGIAIDNNSYFTDDFL